MVTIREISQAFGVSTMTVSNALNDRKGVSGPKAEAIRRYARKMGYRPSYMAKSMLKGRTDMVGLCLRTSPEDPWMAGILHRIQDQLRENGLHLNLCIADGGSERELWALDFFREFRVEAVILGPLGLLEQYNALAGALEHQPYVFAFDAIEALPIDHIKIGAHDGARLAVEHLVRNGHRNIGFVGCHRMEIRMTSLRTRYSGFCEEIRRHGLDVCEDWIIPIEHDDDQIDAPLTAFLQSDLPRPTAFFCHNDIHAARAVKILADHGLRVPQDISIVGFDNQPIADMIIPGITSIGFDVDHYVRQIVARVVQAIQENRQNNGKSPPRTIYRYEQQPELIERASVRRIP